MIAQGKYMDTELPIAHFCQHSKNVKPWSRILCSSCRGVVGTNYSLPDLVREVNRMSEKELAKSASNADPSMTPEYAKSFAKTVVSSMRETRPEIPPMPPSSNYLEMCSLKEKLEWLRAQAVPTTVKDIPAFIVSSGTIMMLDLMIEIETLKEG